jgi:Ca2+-binding EF-hand superfamily protein/ribosomal protein L13E
MPIADIDFREYFPQKRIEQLAFLFQNYDVRRRGALDETSLTAMFRKMGKHFSRQQIRDVMKEVDVDGNGLIDFEEFCVMEIKINRVRLRPDLIDYRDYLEGKIITKMGHLFHKRDSFGRGLLGKAEAQHILEFVGCRVVQEEFDEIYSEAELNDSSEIDFGRLCALYVVLKKKRKRINYREFLTNEQVRGYREMFKMTDTDGSGQVNKSELDQMLRNLGLVLKKPQLKVLFDDFDVDGSGDIDFEEFCVMMLRLRGARRMRAVGPSTCKCSDLWLKEGFTIKELQSSGFSLDDFKKAGISIGTMYREGSVSALELRRAGFSPAELRRGGVSAQELRRCGFSLADLRIAGFSGTTVQAANKMLKNSLSAGDLSDLPQQRPYETRMSQTFPQFEQGVPCRFGNLQPLRQMTPMIREHTDWNPKQGPVRLPPVVAAH